MFLLHQLHLGNNKWREIISISTYITVVCYSCNQDIYNLKKPFIWGYHFLSPLSLFQFGRSSAIMNSFQITFFGNILIKVLFLQFEKYLIVTVIMLFLVWQICRFWNTVLLNSDKRNTPLVFISVFQKLQEPCSILVIPT